MKSFFMSSFSDKYAPFSAVRDAKFASLPEWSSSCECWMRALCTILACTWLLDFSFQLCGCSLKPCGCPPHIQSDFTRASGFPPTVVSAAKKGRKALLRGHLSHFEGRAHGQRVRGGSQSECLGEELTLDCEIRWGKLHCEWAISSVNLHGPVDGNLCAYFHSNTYEFICSSVSNWMGLVPLTPRSLKHICPHMLLSSV